MLVSTILGVDHEMRRLCISYIFQDRMIILSLVTLIFYYYLFFLVTISFFENVVSMSNTNCHIDAFVFLDSNNS